MDSNNDNAIYSENAVTKTDKTASVSDSNAVSVLENLESMIKTHITGIDRRKKELKKLREMVQDALKNDPTFEEHEKNVKEAVKKRNATKNQLLKLPSNQEMVKKTHELSAEIKDMDEALSEYLREYSRISGSNEIETEDGEVREIIYIAKLVKKSSK